VRHIDTAREFEIEEVRPLEYLRWPRLQKELRVLYQTTETKKHIFLPFLVP